MLQKVIYAPFSTQVMEGKFQIKPFQIIHHHFRADKLSKKREKNLHIFGLL